MTFYRQHIFDCVKKCGMWVITAPSDRESSMWKLTIALSCLPAATAYLYQLVSGWQERGGRLPENKLG